MIRFWLTRSRFRHFRKPRRLWTHRYCHFLSDVPAVIEPLEPRVVLSSTTPVPLGAPIMVTGNMSIGNLFALTVQLNGSHFDPLDPNSISSVTTGSLSSASATTGTAATGQITLPAPSAPSLSSADFPCEADFDFSNIMDWSEVWADQHKSAAYSVVMIGGSFETLTNPNSWDYEPSLRAWEMGLASWAPPNEAPGDTSSVESFWNNLVNGGWNPMRWHRWLYTGDPGASDDVYGDALAAAGESYSDNAALAHQALQVLGPLGNVVSSALATIEGADLHTQLMTLRRDQDRADMAQNGQAPSDWSTTLLKSIRDHAGSVLVGARLLDAPLDQSTMEMLADGLINQARQAVVGVMMKELINVIRDDNEDRLGAISDFLEDHLGSLSATQKIELALEEQFLINFENQILAAFDGSADLGTVANITTTLNGIQSLVQSEVTRLQGLPPTIVGGVNGLPNIQVGAQIGLLNALLPRLLQIKDFVPSLVFATNVVKFTRQEWLDAQAQAEVDAQNQQQMQNHNKVILRPNIEMQMTENGTVIYGTAQNTTGDEINPHAAFINQRVAELAATGQYEVITMNLSWRTATGREADSTRRPDIIAVGRDGSFLAIEVLSPSQDPDDLRDRLQSGFGSFGSATSTIRSWQVLDVDGTELQSGIE